MSAEPPSADPAGAPLAGHIDLDTRPHRRFDPLAGQWVLVSPHRASRPWQGQLEPPAVEHRPGHDPDCYLCPGNRRAGGQENPDYRDSFVFTNDFAALLPAPPAPLPTSSRSDPPPPAPGPEPDLLRAEADLLRAEAVRGTCRVLCFSPRHDLTLAEMPPAQLRTVIDLWAEQSAELGRDYRWVQVFENKGALMGASSPHPHGQLWATDVVPELPRREDERQRAYLAAHGRPLLVDYAALERERGHRVVVENHAWLALVPYWAVWPFEALILPRAHLARLSDIAPPERDALAELLARLLVKYDNLFRAPFPYSLGWHEAPSGPDPAPSPHWQLHAHVYPPLLRSATVRKFMVGYELLAEAQRDLTAEAAAARLRAASDLHYRAPEPRR
ncbi:UDP-glucose--hexose-1-phosphate uridylyltransferase [Haliangium sp.]|uniref:UDP-glucose--hexose-1-phosphate uridylyltransferase n=1 Tax=Haliangium sp. TaxID=2663208 RepID=UPI003D0CB886